MPIEFRCPNCNQLLRVPDASAGKQARCPGCGQISPVPMAFGQPIATPATSPFNPFGDAAAAPQKPAAAEEFNPYAAPAPQEKVVAAAAGGPLTHGQAEMGEVLGIAWRICTEDFGQCALVGLLYIAFVIGASVIGMVIVSVAQAIGGNSPEVVVAAQGLNQIVSMLVQTWAWLGGAAWALHRLRSGRADTQTFFSIGPYYFKGLLGIIVFYLIVLIPTALLFGIPFGIGAAIGTPEAMVIGGIAGGVLAVVAAFYLMYTFFLYYFFILDRNAGVLDSFRLSAEYSKGNRLTMFAVAIVAGIGGFFVIACTCYIGSIIVMPFMLLAFAAIYLMATGQPYAGQPPSPAKPIGPI
jgi:hypothetical protein